MITVRGCTRNPLLMRAILKHCHCGVTHLLIQPVIFDQCFLDLNILVANIDDGSIDAQFIDDSFVHAYWLLVCRGSRIRLSHAPAKPKG
jgi:hypothetical protein